MTSRITFKYKIIILMTTTIILVSVIAGFVYVKFSGIVHSVSEASRTDLRLVAAKELLNDLSDAENRVKSYTLTRDTLYLSEYDSIVKKVDTRIFFLYSDLEKSPVEKQRMDSLYELTSLKFEILDQLIALKNEFRVQEALTKVSERVEKLATEDNRDKPKKRLRDYLKRRKEGVDLTSEEKITQINKELSEVKVEESEKEENLVRSELDLIILDKEITGRIRANLKLFENFELEKFNKKTSEAKKDVDNANNLIALFCVIVGILLLFITYVIINYVRNNNRYSKLIIKARNEAQQLAMAKEQFVATISHEIRTPMNSIVGFTEQISQGPLTDLQRSQIDIVKKASDHLLQLINEFLDLTKLQSKKLELNKIGFKPLGVIEEVVELSKPLITGDKLKIQTVFHDDIPEVLIGDPFRLRQIILNLVGNAIKFTSEGTVSIELSTLLRSNDAVQLRIQVIDTGIGIHKNNIQKMFGEFEQEEIKTAREYGGTGLGLSITKRLVELHKGTIDIISEKDMGTTVVLDIPYEIGSSEDLPQEDMKVQPVNGLDNLKVLIVDDEKYNRDLLKAILKKYNTSITEASDGEQAIAELKKHYYDLILMDVRMPKMTGVEATVKIRELKEKNKKNVPIIILTAAVTDEEKTSYFDAGVDQVLAKPFKEEDLLEKMSFILTGEIDYKIQEIEYSSNPEQTMKKSRVDFSDLRKLSNDDKEFYLEMLTTLESGTTKGLEDITKTLEKKDWDRMAEYAHRISSPCKHINAMDLYDYLKEIESRCRNKVGLEEIDEIVLRTVVEGEKVLREIHDELNNIELSGENKIRYQ